MLLARALGPAVTRPAESPTRPRRSEAGEAPSRAPGKPWIAYLPRREEEELDGEEGEAL